MTSADRNITITNEKATREDIARRYSHEHAQVWDLLKRMGQASGMRPPIFEVHSVLADAGGYTLQSRGRKTVESGWLPHFPAEEELLAKQLPESTEVLEQIAEAGGDAQISGVTVLALPPSAGEETLTPAELIRQMKERRIGRPSTYARHVENVSSSVGRGLVRIDEYDGFRITEPGLALLRCLDLDELPSLDVEYSARFEKHLEAIEKGKVGAIEVLRLHLGALPGVEVQIPHGGEMTLRNDAGDAATPAWTGQGFSEPSLPAAIDPESVLPRDHPYRAIRKGFEASLRERLGRGGLSRSMARRERACRVAALARMLGDWSLSQTIERIRLDLALRWLVDLRPSDEAWTEPVLKACLEGQDGVVAELCCSVDECDLDAFRKAVSGVE